MDEGKVAFAKDLFSKWALGRVNETANGDYDSDIAEEAYLAAFELLNSKMEKLWHKVAKHPKVPAFQKIKSEVLGNWWDISTGLRGGTKVEGQRLSDVWEFEKNHYKIIFQSQMKVDSTGEWVDAVIYKRVDANTLDPMLTMSAVKFYENFNYVK